MDSLLKKIMTTIVRQRKLVLVLSLVLIVVNIIFASRVKVDYNLQDYLPADAASSRSLKVMGEEFDFSIPNARAAFQVSSIQEALEIKEKLKDTEGVLQVLWLDDQLDLRLPLENQEEKLVKAFYKDGQALYQLTTVTDNAPVVLNRIYGIQEGVQVAGQLIDLANAQNSVQSEVFKITLFIVPLVLLVLLLSTHAWLEPLIFGLTIGVGIIFNMGSNIFIGKISFITQAIASILQLAVSMDYAIFLLNRFNSNRKGGQAPEVAMAGAMRQAFTAIASSAMTTVFGFLALIFMRFKIGSDLGLVMAKGIAFSFLSVIIFLPCLLLLVYKLVDKTSHRPLLPDFRTLGRWVNTIKPLILLLALIIAVPGFLGSRSNSFIYGMGGYPKHSRMLADRRAIDESFGEQQQMSLMVPRGSIQKELAILDKLERERDIVSVISYVNQVDPAIPSEVLDPDQTAMLLSKNYSQFIITAEIPSEGDRAFGLVEKIRSIAAEEYGESSYQLVGQPVIMLDMKDTIQQDDVIVNGLAILAIALVILMAFKSISLPLILVLTIEIAIWINLSIPYFSNTSVSYIGYLIVSTVQLGATVDYAILYTEHYLKNRRKLVKSSALIESLRETLPSLLPPALILTITGFMLSYISSLAIVSELGLILGRGAFLSLLMVVFVLPAMLFYSDKFIQVSSLGLKFESADKK